MKIIAYLAFTVLSVIIQFVVMELIKEQVKLSREQPDLNATSPKKRFKDILQQYKKNPNALYYRTPDARLERSVTKTYSNLSIQEMTPETSTDLSSTMFDLLYDDNTTVTEDSLSTSPETFFTTTEFGNVTDITIFNKNNESEIPKNTPKPTVNKDCNCNLLYKVCDPNCCCDSDCTNTERSLFKCLERDTKREDYLCYSYSPFSLNTYSIGSNLDNLFCLANSNLPERRNIAARNKHDPLAIDKSFKWHSVSKPRSVQEFTKTPYKYGDPIWLLRKGSIYYVDVPAALFNNYCNNRQPIQFLKRLTTKCNVNLSDLEILQILNTVLDTSVISAIDKTMNTSTLNCSTLHCTNWTITLCDQQNCTKYNESLHDPLCTESACSHLAPRVEYTFNYYENKIMNASITLHTQKVPLNVPFIEQEINVNFVITNESTDNILELSGNPGYIRGLPVIASFGSSNHSKNFFNETSKLKRVIMLPDNKNGACFKSNFSKNIILFGINKSVKCRLYESAHGQNETEICKNLQNNINQLLGFDNIAVAPYGNPEGIDDGDWLALKIDPSEYLQYGHFNERKTKLYCYNFVSRFTLTFTFADVNDEKKKTLKILSSKISTTPANVTFIVEDMSAVVTVDTTFIDETKPGLYEYAGAPHMNIHLPTDFFFPFPSNEVAPIVGNYYIILIFFIASLIKK